MKNCSDGSPASNTTGRSCDPNRESRLQFGRERKGPHAHQIRTHRFKTKRNLGTRFWMGSGSGVKMYHKNPNVRP